MKSETRADTNGIRISADIEGGNAFNITGLRRNHWRVQMRPDLPSIYRYPDHHAYWFYVELKGTVDEQLQIDVTNCDWMPSHWRHYKPVYSCDRDPDSLDCGVWHPIERTRLRGRTFSFLHRYETGSLRIALRYPYNYTRERRFAESVRGNGCLKIEELGRTTQDNSLLMFTITDPDAPERGKKGVLIYAREHGIEQDGSWVTEGIIDFLLSDDPMAGTLRRRAVFMIIPIISPDAAILGRVVNPVTGTFPGRELMNGCLGSSEGGILYRRMKAFVAGGGNLDICISLHNPHGTEPNLYPNYLPAGDAGRLHRAKRLHAAVLAHCSNYTTWKEFTPNLGCYSVGRFARDFNSTAIIYEVNHQAANNYLSILQLKGIGTVLLRGIADFWEKERCGP